MFKKCDQCLSDVSDGNFRSHQEAAQYIKAQRYSNIWNFAVITAGSLASFSVIELFESAVINNIYVKYAIGTVAFFAFFSNYLQNRGEIRDTESYICIANPALVFNQERHKQHRVKNT